MLTTLKLALAAAIAATGGYALQQNSTPIKKAPDAPKLVLTSSTDAPLFVQGRAEKRVSTTIEGSVSDVAKWLSSQGVSFVITDENLSQKRIMLNIVDQPLSVAVDAVAEALGGDWTKKGDVYVFKPGSPLSPSDGKYLRWDSKTAPLKVKDQKSTDDRVFVLPKEGAPDMKWEFQMPKIDFKMPDIDWSKVQDSKGRKLTEAEKKEVERAMAEAKEAMKKAMEEMKSSQKTWVFSDKELKELKELKSKGLSEKQRLEIEKSVKDAKVQVEKALEEAKKSGKLKELKELKVIESGQMGKLMKSLTPAQKELHKKQGFLKPTDLTAEQRKLLPTMEGDWNITFVVDGEKLTIKNK